MTSAGSRELQKANQFCMAKGRRRQRTAGKGKQAKGRRQAKDLSKTNRVYKQSRVLSRQQMHTEGIYEQVVHGGVDCQYDCTGHCLRPDNLLGLQVVGCCDVGSKAPHPG